MNKHNVLMLSFAVILAVKSFITLDGAITFYEELPEDVRKTAQIISIPDRRSFLPIVPYKVYYEEYCED